MENLLNFVLFATFNHKTFLQILIIEHFIVSSLFETKQHIKKFRENSNLPSAWQKQLYQRLVLKAKIGVKYTGSQIHQNSCGKFSTFSFPHPVFILTFLSPISSRIYFMLLVGRSDVILPLPNPLKHIR